MNKFKKWFVRAFLTWVNSYKLFAVFLNLIKLSSFKVQSRAGVGVLCMTLTKKSGFISKLIMKE